MSKPNKLFLLLIVTTLLFCALIGLNILPFLRGPAPYPPEWQWPYMVNFSITKLWAPLLAITGISIFAIKVESSNKLTKKPFIILPIIFILGFLLQLSILYYSRAGIGVLLHRILDPEITSYFAASTHVTSVSAFLQTFNTIYNALPMYASYHPPLATLFFNGITYLLHPLTPLFGFITHLQPTQPDVFRMWSSLNPDEKLTAFFSGFLIMCLSILPIIPLYYTVKSLLDEQLATRSALLFILIPSIILFVPMSDVFMPLFSTTSLYFFINSIKHDSKYSYFLAGLILAIGSLFSLTFIPIILFYSMYWLLTHEQFRHNGLKFLAPVTSFSFGFLLLPYLLFLFTGFNFFESIVNLFARHNVVEHARRYSVGLIYAPFDFFLFLGIPISFLVILSLFSLKSKEEKIQQYNHTAIAFWIFFLLIIVSGAVRVESARIWTPYIPIVLLVAVTEMKKLNITKNKFLTILLLLFLQIIIFQSVLVTVW